MKDLVHIFKNQNESSYHDYSIDLNDYLRGETEFCFCSSDSYYIGFYKPIQKLYLELGNLNRSGKDIKLKYYNGTGYVNFEVVKDDTKNFTRNGFFDFTFNDQRKVTEQWKKTTLNGRNLYWLKVTSDNAYSDEIATSLTGNTNSIIYFSEDDLKKFTHSQKIYIESIDEYTEIISIANDSIVVSPLQSIVPDNSIVRKVVSIKGNNIVFADDIDLKTEQRNINDFLYKNDTSFIAYHVAARNEIIQIINNGGMIKTPDNKVYDLEAYTKWDLFDAESIRQAAKYLCLSKICFDNSLNVQDKMHMKYREYKDMHGIAFSNFYLSLDKNDDGNKEEFENEALNVITVSRI